MRPCVRALPRPTSSDKSSRPASKSGNSKPLSFRRACDRRASRSDARLRPPLSRLTRAVSPSPASRAPPPPPDSISSYGDRPNNYEEVSEYFRAHFIQVHRRKDVSHRPLYLVRRAPASPSSFSVIPCSLFWTTFWTRCRRKEERDVYTICKSLRASLHRPFQLTLPRPSRRLNPLVYCLRCFFSVLSPLGDFFDLHHHPGLCARPACGRFASHPYSRTLLCLACWKNNQC